MAARSGVKYLVFNPSISLTWRQNGAPKTEHRSHLHVSFLATDEVEQSTAPFFEPVGAASARAVGSKDDDEETFMLVQPNQPSIRPGRLCTARLNIAGRTVDLFNGAAIMFDEATNDPEVRRWKIGARAGVPNQYSWAHLLGWLQCSTVRAS